MNEPLCLCAAHGSLLWWTQLSVAAAQEQCILFDFGTHACVVALQELCQATFRAGVTGGVLHEPDGTPRLVSRCDLRAVLCHAAAPSWAVGQAQAHEHARAAACTALHRAALAGLHGVPHLRAECVAVFVGHLISLEGTASMHQCFACL